MNDLVKSIQNSDIVNGKPVDLMDVLEKYMYQKWGTTCCCFDSYAEELGVSKEYMLNIQNWLNDGRPTGIESDEQFEELQKQLYGKVIYRLK